MAAKKRKRARKKNPAKKRAHAKRVHHKRKRASNPPKRRRRAAAKRRHAVSNPPRRRRRRHTAKRAHARRPAVSNPRRHRRSKRRHKSNPDLPKWALAALAAAVGLGAFALANDGSFAITQRTDPTLASLERNRYIVGGAFTVAGLLLAAFASPLFGAGLAAGGLAAFAGTPLSLMLGKVLDKTNPDGSLQRAQLPEGQKVAGVFDASNGVQQLGAVYSNDQQMIGGVYGNGAQLIGGVYDEQSYY